MWDAMAPLDLEHDSMTPQVLNLDSTSFTPARSRTCAKLLAAGVPAIYVVVLFIVIMATLYVCLSTF